MSTLNSLIGIGGTFATSAYNNFKAERMQERARQENFFYNERAAENANKRWQDNYEKYFTPSSQVRMLKEAGLSPSLMLAGGAAGGGGTAPSPQGGGAQGLQNNYFPASAIEAAQIANLAADTKQKEAVTENTERDTITKELQNFITQNTIPDTIEGIKQEVINLKADLQKTISETQGIDWKNAFNLITQDEQVQQLINKNAELTARVAELEARKDVHNADIALKEQERQNLIQKCKNMQEEITQKYIELDIYRDEQMAQEAWFEEQAYIMLKDFNLKQDMFDFEIGEKWEFEKYKVGKQISLAGWKLGLDFGASMLQNVTDLVGSKQAGMVKKEIKQMDINQKNKPRTSNNL